ncbi:CgeB family protein [Cohnella fermenti]|uniref:Spore maturation protein n=1 Tax=Cohnella fermenti TaxID=2565925 RepID=A0A4S4BLX3_9BACL|nr:glycosyltransferase [Cohnella fermenti]THF73363.1 spore maturation protein [Cohnella fermenti]
MGYSSREKLRQEARRDGYGMGWSEGWRLGACQGIAERTPEPSAIPSRLRIMYVPQGFEAIDEGMVSALTQCASGLTVAQADRMRELAAETRPDWVLVMNGLHVFPGNHLEQIDAIRAMGIRTAIWFVDDPYVTDETPEIAKHYDMVITHERSCVPLYIAAGCAQVRHLPLAVNPRIFQPKYVPPEYRSDICFIGVAFENRVNLFDEMADFLQDKKVFLSGKLWERMKRYSDLSRFVHDGWIPVAETVNYYNGARLVINLHRTTEAGKDNRNAMNWGAESINPRTYEIASCGVLQLTDERKELSEQYELGREIVAFRSADELMAQIDYYLNHEEERRQIAARGFKRTRLQHTFVHRIQTLLGWLE